MTVTTYGVRLNACQRRTSLCDLHRIANTKWLRPIDYLQDVIGKLKGTVTDDMPRLVRSFHTDGQFLKRTPRLIHEDDVIHISRVRNPIQHEDK